MQRPNVAHLFCWVPALWSAVRVHARKGGDTPLAACDAPKLRSEVSRLYARVATEPDGDFHFHRGAEYASTLLDYDPAALAAIPRSSTDSFAGVGNPHIIDPIRPGEVVLDIGCGSGTDLLLAARQVGPGGRAIGVEMTDEMLQRCRSSIVESGLRNVEVRPGDAENLPVEDHSIDTVISNGVLNLVPDKERALREIHRVLRPGGRLLLADIALTSGLAKLLRSSVDLWALCVGGALRDEEVVSLVTETGFAQARTTHQFDCIRGASSEFLARRLGVHGINLYARKPETTEVQPELAEARTGRQTMSTDRLEFNVTGMDIDIVETVPIKWQGRVIDSGPIHITLGEPGSHGVIDYEAGTVEVEFRSQIQFPELAEALEDLGADPSVYAPVKMVIRSKGSVLEGHCLRLAGKGVIDSHRLFTPNETRVDVRAPSQCKPDLGSGSGDEIREALRNGKSVSWNFNPAEKRVELTLPESLGGETHLLSLAGSYTLTVADPSAASS